MILGEVCFQETVLLHTTRKDHLFLASEEEDLCVGIARCCENMFLSHPKDIEVFWVK